METAHSSPVLIGRADLVALAARRLTAAAAGRGELLFLAGEAGIGKTRLLAEIVRRARADAFTVVTAGAAPGDAEVPAGLLADLAAAMCRQPPTAEAGARMAARLRSSADEPRRFLVTGLTDLVAAAVAKPLLVALEDLHWADDLTIEVLGRLGRRAPELPLLLVGTYRSDELYPRVPMRQWRTRLLTQRQAEEVRLTRLSLDDTAAMAAAIAGGTLPGTVTGAVFARSDGIPLHVEEFLAARDRVPDTLADAVLARAEQLTDGARGLAGVASVLGRSFDLDLLTAITGDDKGAVDDGLRELAERFFVQPQQDTYDFRHALIRDALYADLAPHRRRELHARAAAAAAAAGFPAAFVSDQYERAARPGLAFAHARSAAGEAAAMSAHREAAELYRRARRTMPVELPAVERVELCTALARELATVDENEAAAECFAEAYRLRLELDDPLGAAELVPDWVAVRHLLGADLDERTAMLRGALPLIAFRSDDPAQEVRAGIHAALAAAYMLDRRLGEAVEDGELARSIAVEDCDRAMRCNLDATLGSVFLFAGRLDEGYELLEDSIARATGWRFEGQAARGYRMLGSSASVLVEYDRALRWLSEGIAYAERVEQVNDRHYLVAHLAHVRWAIGDWDTASVAAAQALAEGGGITTRITALHVLGYLAMGRGQLATAVEHLSEAASLGAGMRELQRVSPAWWGLAEVALLGGDVATAIARCEEGFAASARVRDAAYLFPYVVTGVRAYLASAGPDAARQWLGRTAALLTERGIPGTLGAVPHGRGLIERHEGRTGKARESLSSAAAFWAQRRRFWEGTAALMELGDPAAAQRAYAAVGAACPTYLDVPAARSTLSAREIQVARLVAYGLTNRQIAAELTIAPKTAAAHVEHIRTKLGVSRRAQIAAWVATQR
ncbi:ATP-binding protein [Paractinoplanes rishiriensis]|uniref:HTH luxR-type domain-containing protein n=1 Tax=Paractinoplanes rishiriensis TaxID=1050105 RepID=A0A919MZ05_9ACTN|nr:LuxR family transcriptional regulator [Actinoplanes rishiriensis]GIE93187.1 hypothetical protein Ari01nite_06520 [Actinoplanes rishiriensis]